LCLKNVFTKTTLLTLYCYSCWKYPPTVMHISYRRNKFCDMLKFRSSFFWDVVLCWGVWCVMFQDSIVASSSCAKCPMNNCTLLTPCDFRHWDWNLYSLWSACVCFKFLHK
jgi:hypothetical protein